MEHVAIKKTDIPDYDPTRDYFVSNIVGDCMNAPDSPAIVGDGGRVLCHKIDKKSFLRDWEQYRGRAVVFELSAAHPLAAGGRNMIKEFVRVDYGLFMVFRFHNPSPTSFSIGTDEFTAIAIVDRVLTRTRESESKKVPIEGESFAENTRNFRENFPVTDA